MREYPDYRPDRRAALSLPQTTTGGAMNNPEIDLRALSDAASPGPWQWLDGDGESYDELQDGRGEQIATGFREDIVLDGRPINRDGSFAAAAANYVRAALDAARTPAPDLRAVIDHWYDDGWYEAIDAVLDAIATAHIQCDLSPEARKL